jgi:hypothetical protein
MESQPEIMKELKIQTPNLSPQQLVDIIGQFCTASEHYSYMQEVSDEYALHIGKPACEIHAIYKEPFPLLAFAQQNKGLYLANIVPKTVSQIGISEYNLFLDAFVEEFRAFAKGQQQCIRVLVSSGMLVLEEIISSELARKHFVHFLNNHPLSMHPLDIERLDKFICVASSYSRKALDLNLLYRYLRELVGWSAKDSGWCIDRIRIGLDVLNVKKKMLF